MFRSAALSLPSTPHLMRRIGRAVLACSALAVLSACGGGDRAEPYQPDRVVVFGDENSAFASQDMGGGNSIRGLVFTVNAVGPFVAGVYTRFCSDVSTPTSVCQSADFLPGAFSNFDASDDGRPFGTGSYITPGSDLVNTPVNAVRMVGVGFVTRVVPGALPEDPSVSTRPELKRDSIVQYACSERVIAAHRIAHEFGKAFGADVCPLDTREGAKTFAAAGAKIAGLQAQVNQAIGQGLLGKGSLVTVWIGQNDIIEIFESGVYGTLQAKRNEAKVRAESLAQVILQIYHTGAKVIVIGATDLGYSPWAVGLGVPACGAAAAPCPNVQDVVNDFNDTLKLGDSATGYKGLQDLAFQGRHYTFVDAARSMRDFARNSGFNATGSACVKPGDDPLLLNRSVKPDGSLAGIAAPFAPATSDVFEVQHCTQQSLKADAATVTYVWADDRRLAPVAHQALANAALIRAVNSF